MLHGCDRGFVIVLTNRDIYEDLCCDSVHDIID